MSGKTLTTLAEQLSRWTEYFSALPNREKHRNPPRFEGNAPELDIDTNQKAPGYDELPTELLKANIEQATEALSVLLKIIWEEEKIPSEWQKGLVTKLPKKGDLSNCNNWRGGNPIIKIILMRIERTVESQLRKGQAVSERVTRAQNRSLYYGTLSSSALNGNQPSALISSTSKRLLTVYIARPCGKF